MKKLLMVAAAMMLVTGMAQAMDTADAHKEAGAVHHTGMMDKDCKKDEKGHCPKEEMKKEEHKS